ncbi:MAG TPA: pentapeptide repeat-containing protein [Saprospiraceae bacterium]|nr:pentapeptide repeat-containing protein [Saprospiraceae bacterium]
MGEEKEQIILKGALKWSLWRKNNPGSLYFNRPNWYQCLDSNGLNIKGQNQLNFSGIDLSGSTIYDAFAEGINFSAGIFMDTSFEEGDFSRANFSNAIFINTKFNKTILTDANFNGASFVNCNLNRVNLTNAQFCLKEIRETVIYGISVWDLHTCDSMIQSKLIIEKTYELYSDLIKKGIVPLMVDDIELAQFIYYMTDHKKMRNTINILNSKGVLLLGQFKNGGMERLYKLQEWLQKKDYMPMIFDFARPDNLDLTETIVTMAGLSKFIIADLSGGSVPQELYAIATNFKKPIIAFSKGKAYSLFQDIKRKNSNVLDFEIENDDELDEKLMSLIPEVEAKNRQIILELAEIYK